MQAVVVAYYMCLCHGLVPYRAMRIDYLHHVLQQRCQLARSLFIGLHVSPHNRTRAARQ